MSTGEDTVVLVTRPGDAWELERLPSRLADDLDALVAALRQSGGGSGAIGLVDLDDDVVVLVRVAGGGHGSPVRLVLSDLAAALDFDLAGDVADSLGLDVPEDDDGSAGLTPVGDLGMLAEFGFDATSLTGLLSDEDAYASELLARLATSLGFGSAWARVVAPRPARSTR